MNNKVKAILKQKVVPVWALIAVALVTVIMFLLGFKFVYAPYLDNCWDAIIATGTWVSAIISGIALIYAVRIPLQIAQQQNRITLFEKRYEFREVMQKCIAIANMLENVEEFNMFDVYLFSTFSDLAFSDLSNAEQVRVFNNDIQGRLGVLSYITGVLTQYPFLFGDEIKDGTLALISSIIKLAAVREIPQKKEFLQLKAEYMRVVKRVDEEIIPIINEKLMLSRNG